MKIMKKVYLDWNVINHLEESPELYEFILQNKAHFVFVYSPAHFSDLMKSYQEGEGNTYFKKDLERLETVCETHLMVYSNKKLNLYRCPPSEFMEKEGKDYPVSKFLLDSNLLEKSMRVDGLDLYGIFSESLKSVSFGSAIELPLFGSFSNAFELLNCSLDFIEKLMTDKEFVKTVRKGATNTANDKEITCINDYNPNEVIGAINAFFASQGTGVDVEGIIKKVIIDEQHGNEMLVFESLYAGLDLMRYHPDKRDLMNILTDADHAFYGSYCDVLVTDDAKMRYKAEAVYSYYGITTKIIGKQDLLQYLKNEINGEMKIEEPLKEVLSNQHIPEKYNEDDIYLKWTKLDNPFLGYFDKLEYQLYLSSGWFCFAFTKELRYTYFTETEKLFEIIKSMLHEPKSIELFEKDYVEKYRANDKSATFSFYLAPTIHMVLAVAEEGEYIIPVLYMVPQPSISAA